jgi:hypothetical protein
MLAPCWPARASTVLDPPAPAVLPEPREQPEEPGEECHLVHRVSGLNLCGRSGLGMYADLVDPGLALCQVCGKPRCKTCRALASEGVR